LPEAVGPRMTIRLNLFLNLSFNAASKDPSSFIAIQTKVLTKSLDLMPLELTYLETEEEG
jgi:hypothetical protein